MTSETKLSVTDRTALQRAASMLGAHAKLLAAFGTEVDGRTWNPSEGGRKTKAEHDEAKALAKTLTRMATKRDVAVTNGVAELRDGDI